jgi:hypothetical protein
MKSNTSKAAYRCEGAAAKTVLCAAFQPKGGSGNYGRIPRYPALYICATRLTLVQHPVVFPLLVGLVLTLPLPLPPPPPSIGSDESIAWTGPWARPRHGARASVFGDPSPLPVRPCAGLDESCKCR